MVRTAPDFGVDNNKTIRKYVRVPSHPWDTALQQRRLGPLFVAYAAICTLGLKIRFRRRQRLAPLSIKSRCGGMLSRIICVMRTYLHLRTPAPSRTLASDIIMPWCWSLGATFYSHCCPDMTARQKLLVEPKFASAPAIVRQQYYWGWRRRIW